MDVRKTMLLLACAACAALAARGEMKTAPVWDLAKDAGETSAALRRDGSLPLDAAHAFTVPHTAVKDASAFTVELKMRTDAPAEKTVLSLLRQRTADTGWSLDVTLWGGIGSPISLGVNDAAFNAGWFRSRPGEVHTFTVAAKKGLVVVYWNGRLLKRFFQVITPNLEPISVGATRAHGALAEMKGARLLSLRFWGPEEAFYAKGETQDFAEGFRGGPGWLMSCPTEDPAARLPRVLLYGDSILGGYGPRLRRKLAGRAYVYTWGGFVSAASGRTLAPKAFAAACAVRPFDVIVFNNGLHSLHWTEDKVPDEQLRDTQRQIYLNFRAGAPQAKILWLSTTPHTAREKNAAGKVEALGALDPVVRRINRLTGEAMDAAGVPSIDGYGLLAGRLDLAAGDGYHWRGEAYDLLADRVAEAVAAALAK